MEDYNGATLTEQQEKDLRAASMRDNLYLTQKVEEIDRKVTEIHQFISGIGQALNSPMLRSLMPVEFQSMIPKGK